MGDVITFHSYKGGVGRTMTIANVAALLAKWGYKTLVMDWDLESPGLRLFYQDYLGPESTNGLGGIIDLLDFQVGSTLYSFKGPAWKDLIVQIDLSENQAPLHFIDAGKKDETYLRRVRRLDLDEFYGAKNGGFIIEWLRDQWKDEYDFVLIDSETGIAEIGGICTIQLPDILVLVFSANKQTLSGAVDIAEKAIQARKSLPVDRLSLMLVPILSKFDSTKEFARSREWLTYSAIEISSMYSNWLPKSIDKREFLQITRIPYVPYYSFGEELPVLAETTEDPTDLVYAYENLATLIAHALDFPEQLILNRKDFIRLASKSEKKTRSSPQVFLSYAKEDLHTVRKIYRGLLGRGVNVWFDKENLGPGRWKTQIQKAIARSRYFVICISENALLKIGDEPGFQDSELNIAFSIALEQPETNFTIVPVRLEDCGFGDSRISGFQQYDLFDDFDAGLDKLAKVLVTL